MSKILLSSDIRKVKGISLEKIKYLIESFQIIEESYRKDEYIGLIKVSYDQLRVKNFLREKNISFSQPENIDAIRAACRMCSSTESMKRTNESLNI